MSPRKTYILKLYVAGNTPNSMRALKTLRKIKSWRRPSKAARPLLFLNFLPCVQKPKQVFRSN